jgi:hypothetical protein
MKASKVLACLAVFSFVVMISDSAFAEPVTKIKIASYIGVEIGGDIAQYEETLAYSRNQTRKMYMDEVIDAAVKMSGGIFDPTDMLGPLQKLQDSADGKRDINKEIDSAKIGLSVGEFFKSEIEKLHRVNGITNAERKIEFANAFPVINGHMVYNSKAQYDHYIFIHMAHINLKCLEHWELSMTMELREVSKALAIWKVHLLKLPKEFSAQLWKSIVRHGKIQIQFLPGFRVLLIFLHWIQKKPALTVLVKVLVYHWPMN